jgi:hypothetical protein
MGTLSSSWLSLLSLPHFSRLAASDLILPLLCSTLRYRAHFRTPLSLVFDLAEEVEVDPIA